MYIQRAEARRLDSRCRPVPVAVSDDVEKGQKLTFTFESLSSMRGLGDLAVGAKPQPS